MADGIKVDIEKLMPCMALGCTLASFYPDWPECIGFKSEGICICCEIDVAGCKVGNKPRDDVLVVCFAGSYYCVKPTTCCKLQNQCFCIDGRAALPCDEDHTPMMCTICCITCCMSKKKNIAVGKKLGDIRGGGAPVVSDDMER